MQVRRTWLIAACVSLPFLAAIRGDEPAGGKPPASVDAAPREAGFAAASGEAAAARLALAVEARRREAAVQELLQQRVTNTFEDVPLDEALGKLASDAKANFWVDRDALAEDGIAVEEPVTASWKNATVEQALDRMLPPLRLGWFIDGEVVRITTQLVADEVLVTRVYDVRDLLALGEKSTPKTAHHADDDQQRLFVQFESDSPGAHPPRPPLAPSATPTGRSVWLVSLLLDVTSGSWESVDGTGGTLTLGRGLLSVRQSREQQKEVAGVLASLRTLAAGGAESRIVEVRGPDYPYAEDAAIVRALAKSISVNYQQKPLQEAVADLSRQSGIVFLIDVAALSEEGIATDEPVSLTLNDVTVETVLRLLLEPLHLTHWLGSGRLEITTRIAAEERLDAAIYDVRDLIDAGIDSNHLSRAIIGETDGPWEPRDGTGGTLSIIPAGFLAILQTARVHQQAALLLHDLRQNLKDGPQQPPEPQPDPEQVVIRLYSFAGNERAAAVLSAIKQLIAAETWDRPGTAGRGESVESTLMIRQTVAVHREIEELLQQLDVAEAAQRRKEGRTGENQDGSQPSGGGGFYQRW